MENDKPTIIVRIKSNYGVEHIYPLTFVDELQLLTKQKTLLRNQIEALKRMGFNFEVEGQKL